MNSHRKIAALKEFNHFLRKTTDCGYISRQELVSMLPPLFLDIKKDDLVLDMCAAPGSKSVQILEIFHSSVKDPKDLINSQGGILANDVDSKRAWILSHQMKRLNSPSFAIINHSGQNLPLIACEKEVGENPDSKHEVNPSSEQNGRIYFDKVLADVPCSGDGAIRKIPTRFKHWSPLDGVHLHHLQLQILNRAINLAKIGGLIVYSTCSLNPIENEAVVAEILRKANKNEPGTLELIDVNNTIPGFKMRPGLIKWSVY